MRYRSWTGAREHMCCAVDSLWMICAKWDPGISGWYYHTLGFFKKKTSLHFTLLHFTSLYFSTCYFLSKERGGNMPYIMSTNSWKKGSGHNCRWNRNSHEEIYLQYLSLGMCHTRCSPAQVTRKLRLHNAYEDDQRRNSHSLQVGRWTSHQRRRPSIHHQNDNISLQHATYRPRKTTPKTGNRRIVINAAGKRKKKNIANHVRSRGLPAFSYSHPVGELSWFPFPLFWQTVRNLGGGQQWGSNTSLPPQWTAIISL